MFILTFISIGLILSHGKVRRTIDGLNVDGSKWDPFLYISNDLDDSPSYDITRWVRQLHLQQCVFVEIGEGFCALFVELRSIPSDSKVLDNSSVGEFFLGICPCLTLHYWNLCSPELTIQRKAECTFAEATSYSNTSARVHRRLCDATLLSESASLCNCSTSIAGQRLHKTKGFPTCFLNPLPESLCSPRGVCGVAQCSAKTIKGIHTSQCAPNCHQKQPFCEEIGPWTSLPVEMNSVWSRWSTPKCNNSCGSGFMVAVTSCQDQRKAGHRLHRARIILVSLLEEVILSPQSMTESVNFSSCPDMFGKCYCEVNIVHGIMRAARFTEPCISIEGCISSNSATFTFEGELDPGNSVDSNEVYENEDRERFEDTLPDSESLRSYRRRLLQAYGREDAYGSRENRLANVLAYGRGHRAVPGSRIDDDDYDEDDEEDKGDESSDKGDYDADEGDEDEDEPIDLRRSVRGHWSPRNRARMAEANYAPVAFGGKPVDERRDTKDQTTEECEDDTTEPLQYYDYEESGGYSLSKMDITFAVKLVALNILLWFFGH